MSIPFDATRELIIVTVQLYGPTGDRVVQLAVDTGATVTVVNSAILVLLGYDPATAPDRLQITTGSGVEFVARLPLAKLEALGQERLNFPVIAHTLPPSATVDGLLGLDFFRNQMLTIDFRNGLIDIS